MAKVAEDQLIVTGARENNLKNVSVHLPHNKLIVVTGLSGSGKSSLAFDTIYSEGQRRYMETFSAYARQFVGNMVKFRFPAALQLPQRVCWLRMVIRPQLTPTRGA